MPKKDPSLMSDSELATYKKRLENVKNTLKKREAKKLSINMPTNTAEPSPPLESTPTPEPIEPPPLEIRGSEHAILPATNGEGKAMQVPDISNITPLRPEPTVETHVLGNGNMERPSTPPTIEGEELNEFVQPSNEPVDIGNATVKQNEPNEIPTPQMGEAPPALPGEPVTPMAEGPDGPGIAMNEKQAQITFDKAIEGYNNLAKEITSLLSINPEKIKEFNTAEQKTKDGIINGLAEYDAETYKSLAMDEEDIALIRDPAIAVMQEEGLVKDNKTLLKYGLIYIGGKKVLVLGKTIFARKKVKQAIIEEITEGLKEMDNLKVMANDILKEAKKQNEEAALREKVAIDTLNQMNEIKRNLENLYGEGRVNIINPEVNKQSEPRSPQATMTPTSSPNKAA